MEVSCEERGGGQRRAGEAYFRYVHREADKMHMGSKDINLRSVE